MKHAPLYTAIAMAMTLSPTDSTAGGSANVALTTDYVFRGVSQTFEDPAIQGGFDYAFESGFYLGTWASNVDFVDAGIDDGADMEWDLYFGYAGQINDQWSYDIGYIQYIYPGTVSGVDYDFGELLGSVTYADWLTMAIAYSNDQLASSEDGIYYEASASRAIGDTGLDWSASVGYFDLDDVLGDSYSTWSLGVSKSFDNYTIGLGYHDTDNSGERLFGDNADSRLVLTFSAEF